MSAETSEVLQGTLDLMVLQTLRANPETEATPVVVLSNYMEPPLIQRALQLGRILAQHRQRFRFFNSQMRSHLAVAIDIDADVDAAEVGWIEPDFETALAAVGRRHDFHGDAAQRHRCAGRGRDRQL